jgi:hypothetical protein
VVLEQPDGVAVRIPHRCDKPALADVVHRLLRLGAGGGERCERPVDVVDRQ